MRCCLQTGGESNRPEALHRQLNVWDQADLGSVTAHKLTYSGTVSRYAVRLAGSHRLGCRGPRPVQREPAPSGCGATRNRRGIEIDRYPRAPASAERSRSRTESPQAAPSVAVVAMRSESEGRCRSVTSPLRLCGAGV